MLIIFLFLIWQKWTKYWTKVVIHGNLVPTVRGAECLLTILLYNFVRFATSSTELMTSCDELFYLQILSLHLN